jgi:hypothetical protein
MGIASLNTILRVFPLQPRRSGSYPRTTPVYPAIADKVRSYGKRFSAQGAGNQSSARASWISSSRQAAAFGRARKEPFR